MTIPTISGMTERDALVLVRDYVEARRQARRAKNVQDLHGVHLKAYLDHRGRDLYDGETDYEARLVERQGAPTYDTLSMPDAMILAAAKAGALNVDHEVVLALRGKALWVDDIKRYEMPGKTTTALDVKKRWGE